MAIIAQKTFSNAYCWMDKDIFYDSNSLTVPNMGTIDNNSTLCAQLLGVDQQSIMPNNYVT